MSHIRYNFAGPLILAAALLGLASSCAGGGDGRAADGPKEYPLMAVSAADRKLPVKYTAVLRGCQDVEVRPEVSGLITKVCVSEGAAVRKGEVLFVIDQVPYKAALRKAEAAVATAEAGVANARLDLDGKEELYKENVISDYELRNARNTYKSAEAALKQAQAQLTEAANNLSYTEVKSPVDGVAGMTSFRVGALVGPTMAEPLMSVSDNSLMYAYFSMNEQQALELAAKYGTMADAAKAYPPVGLELKDGSLYESQGRIDVISGIVDRATGTVSLRANFPNDKGRLLSGGSASVVLTYDRPGALVIPQGATYEIQDKIFTYRVIDGTAVATPIEVFGINDGKEYIVLSGLSAGDTIVASGAGLLKAGTKVTAMKHQSNQEAK